MPSRKTVQRDPDGRLLSEYEEEEEEEEYGDAILKDGQTLRVPLYMRDGAINPNLLPHQRQGPTRSAARGRQSPPIWPDRRAPASQTRISAQHRCCGAGAQPAGLRRLRRRRCCGLQTGSRLRRVHRQRGTQHRHRRPCQRLRRPSARRLSAQRWRRLALQHQRCAGHLSASR
jgi:hypothetical protein